MSAFEMIDVVSADFDTGYNVLHYPVKVQYVDGVLIQTKGTAKEHVANVQPLSEKEIGYLQNGGERIVDSRKLYITTPIEGLSLDSVFEFLGHSWKVFKYDARPENTYYKIIVARVDE